MRYLRCGVRRALAAMLAQASDLHAAARAGDVARVRALLDAGVSPN
ncbi:MAG: hypothetical protein ABFD86_10585 [Bryobacteraceae bacterium]